MYMLTHIYTDGVVVLFISGTSSSNGYSVMSQVSSDLRATIADLLIPTENVVLEEMVGKGMDKLYLKKTVCMEYYRVFR